MINKLKKNIIFIDIGHSKTTFILSSFKHDEFNVIDVECLPYLGGRNIDFIILKHILDDYNKNDEVKKELKNQHIDEFEPDPKLLLRILESIEKGRKALTVNKDTTILVESLFADIDLEYKLKKEEFEKLIKKDFLDEFEKHFSQFYKTIIKSKYTIDYIEMCGELIRIPILQEIVKKVTGMEISEKILIDECPSVGAALYGNYKHGTFPINTFKTLHEFNLYSHFKIYSETEPKNDRISQIINNSYKELNNNQFLITVPNPQKIKTFKIKIEYNTSSIKYFIEDLVFYECEIKLNELKIQDKTIYIVFENHDDKLNIKGIYNEKQNVNLIDKKKK